MSYQNVSHFKKLLVGVLTAISTSNAVAAIPGGDDRLSADLITNYYLVKADEKPFDIAQYVPINMQPSDNSSVVLKQVADRSVSTFFDSPEMQNNSLVRTSKQIENKMKQEITVGSSQDIQHKFSFQVQAFQSLAKVEYTGFTHATLSYKASDATTQLEISEKFAKNKELLMAQTNNSIDRVSSVGVRFNF